MDKKVFIDTNIFISNKFMLSNNKFKKLKEYIKENKVTLLYNEITEKELDFHIKKEIEEGINNYNNVLNKHPLLTNTTKLSEKDKNNIYMSFKENLKEFFCNSVNLPLEIDIKSILEDHFNLKLPFESKKPNEFKDAFVIQMIKKYQIESKNDEKICIISRDKGFRESFLNNEKFIIFNDISEFIDKTETEILKKEYEKYIINEIKNGKINDYEIKKISLEYIDSSEKKDIITSIFNIKLNMEVIITYLDEDSSYYDKEEGKYLLSNYITAKEKHNAEFELVVSYDTKESENIKDEFFPDYITIDKEKSDKRINLDRDTCEDVEILDRTYDYF